jgi:hypothetical protein
MKVMETLQSYEITQVVAKMIESEYIVFSDKSINYVVLKNVAQGYNT